jgi:lysophospholipid acyltransferase (LPLAT)-like uncharacterized protein
MTSFGGISKYRVVQTTVGVLAAEYLRLVWKTSRAVFEPADFDDKLIPEIPFILAMWHGQHLMTPFARHADMKVKALISRHGDGEINAIAIERLGIGAVRGSGDRSRRFDLKGGVGAFKRMLDALTQGYCMAVTADFPKVARVAGTGIVLLARYSGRPIYPIAIATSRRIQLRNWDRTTVNLPFSRMAIVLGQPVRVPADADNVVIESARQAVEQRLNMVTARAYELVDTRSAFSCAQAVTHRPQSR